MNTIKSLIWGNNENGDRSNAEQGGNGPPNNRNNRNLLNLDVNDAPLFPARRNIVKPRLASQNYVGAAYGSAINLRRNIGKNGQNAGLNNNTKRSPLQLKRETIQQTNIASHKDNAPKFGAVPKKMHQSYDKGGVNTEQYNSTRSRQQDRGSNPRSLDNTREDHRSNHYTRRVSSVDNIYTSRDSLVGNNGRNSSTGRRGGRFQHGGNFRVGPFQQAPGNHQNYRRNHQRQGQDLRERSCQYGENSGNQESRGSTGGGAYKQILGYKRLEELTKQNPEEVITVLANQNSGFYDLLKSDTLRPDLVILLVKALAISCKVEFNELKSSILASTFQEKFLDRLITLIGKLPTDDRMKHCFKYVIGDCLILCKAVMKLLPNNACDSFPRLFMTMNGALDGMKLYQNVNLEKESTHLKELQEQLIIAIEERQMRRSIASKATVLLQHIPPPDNFRELSIFPTSKDIMSLEKPFIRPNIVEGAYMSVEHYLDVQFRLMREDFVKPLREGISEYLNMTNLRKKGHVGSVRIYHKVLFQETRAVKDKIGLMVCFDPDKKMSKINWERAKRFLFGSLLCFTQDNFQTVLFATVVDRDFIGLKEGRIMIEFCEGTNSPNNLRKQEYVMVESGVYFEPYHHVLKALQKMDEDIFPMSEYIVEVQPESYLPKYFTNENVRYDLDGHIFPVLDERAWPRASQLKLDESQFQAFKSALTKEFVVIQGPPGTGKTYLGLKVARALLQNSKSWNQAKTPVLVVCFTNHALDQFLEGLIPVTNNLVRVGRQSKSEVLNKFSLRERKNESRRKGNIHALLLDNKNKQSELLVRIKSIQEDIEILTKHVGVVSLSTLKKSGLDKGVLKNFYKDNKLSDRLFLDWLKSGLDDYRNVDCTDDRMLDSLLPPYPVEATEWENIYNSDMEQDEEVIFDSDIGFDIDAASILPQVKLVVDFSEMREEATRMKQEINKLEDTFRNDAALYNRRWILEARLAESNLLLKYLSARLKDRLDVCTAQRLVKCKNLWNLTPHKRWTLYKHWVSNLKQTFQEEATKLGEEFRTNARILNEAKLLDDLEVMKDATVIGMTTTGAARLQPLLQALKCKLVIVEEAAEVMESHIIVSLTKYCQHLILIGDHQQLRPTTADFTLARKYYFDISLFERMLKNGMHCEMLKVQHRMRPDIAKLIVPAIYPELFNHESVLGFDNIMGISKSVFFVTHNHYEEKVDDDSASHMNIYEADYVLALCRHLLMQGYPPHKITILTTYARQMFHLRTERKKHRLLKDVQITVVDNFQGEENDIILLSLVRSNKEANIGFLKIENRVCVALSRAKQGFYIIGNMDNLTQSSAVWPKIKASLKSQEAVGPCLTLRCQVHPEQWNNAYTAADFAKHAPEGGCLKLCNILMLCGHVCQSVCHVKNRDHNNYKCQQPCSRYPLDCKLEHRCPKRCFENCGECVVKVERKLPCGHLVHLPCHVDYKIYKCTVNVAVTLPHCEHPAEKPCYRDLATFPCPRPCEDRLPCGHSCELKCHVLRDPDHLLYKCSKPCAKLNAGCIKKHPCAKRCHEACASCIVPFKKTLACGHTHMVECSKELAEVICKRDCRRILPCNHKCKLPCHKPCGDCQKKVVKVFPECKHQQMVSCSESPDPAKCKRRCVRELPCGHRCTGICNKRCDNPCKELVTCSVSPACGHIVQVPCHMQASALPSPSSEELLSYCRQPCGTLLRCEHTCKGTCGECMQGRIHVPCGEKCGRTLICGHSCDSPCAQTCPPCNRKCTYKCKHSQCSKKCGEPCTPCKEPCSWGCVHTKCTKRCHEPCDREACIKPCKEILRCKHPCIGFCGDPCPPLCRVCDEDEVTAIFFGFEDEENARFVYLEDCKHTVESQGLETWLEKTESEISMKVCPFCKTSITKTQRYTNLIKAVYQDVCKVKAKVFGDMKDIEASRGHLQQQLANLRPELLVRYGIVTDCPMYLEVYNKLTKDLQPVHKNRRNILSIVDTSSLKIQIDILTKLFEEVKKANPNIISKLNSRLQVLLTAVSKRQGKMTNQEVEDINLELLRFQRLSQLLTLDDIVKGRANDLSIKNNFISAQNTLYSVRKYSKDQDDDVKTLLENLNKSLKGGLNISEKERSEILSAIGVTPGHWFKCPNGHIYVITECGGAMEVSTCNECGERIGGQQHTLLETNRLANEMDGASFAAWSNNQNMANYDLRHLQIDD